LHTLRYLRAMAKVACARAVTERELAAAQAAAPGPARAALAAQALTAREALIVAVREVYTHLLAIAGNPGELGTLANWEQHLLPGLVDQPGEVLAAVLGRPLPPSAVLPRTYAGPPRVIVPTVRTMVRAGEVLSLRVLMLAAEPPATAAVVVRALGATTEVRLPLRHLARNVYTVDLPPGDAAFPGFEYHVTATWRDGSSVSFPATAPPGQTVVTVPDGP